MAGSEEQNRRRAATQVLEARIAELAQRVELLLSQRQQLTDTVNLQERQLRESGEREGRLRVLADVLDAHINRNSGAVHQRFCVICNEAKAALEGPQQQAQEGES